MRKYHPIWQQLKATNQCAVSAPKAFHARIVKAVINEKYYDIGFKLLVDESCRTVRLSSISEGGRLRFFLIYYNEYTLGVF